MQIKSRIVRISSLIIVAFCGLLSLLILDTFRDQKPDNAVLVPEAAEWSMRLDPVSAAKDELYTLLIEAKDEQLIKRLQQIAEKRLSKRDKMGSLTVDFNAPVVCFITREKDRRFAGLLFTIENAGQFKKNIGNYLMKGQTAVVRGHRALVLSVTDPNNCPNAGTLQKLAESYLNSTKPVLFPRASGNQLFAFTSGKTGTGKLRLTGSHDSRDFSVNGTWETSLSHTAPAYSLRSRHLLISSSIVPRQLSDSLNRYLPFGGYRLPELRAVTIDYQGIGIYQPEGGFFVVPQFNMILEGKSDISLKAILANIPPEMKGEKADRVIVGKQVYFLKQLDAKSLFVGTDTTTVVRNTDPSILRIKGTLEPLLNISSNSALVNGLLSVLPAYNAGKHFVSATESVSFAVAPETGSKYSIRGTMRFREGKYPLHEAFRLAVGMQLLD